MKSPIGLAIKESGLTQEQVAEKMGVSRQAVTRWVAGNAPTVANLRRLSELLGTTVGRLSGDEPNPALPVYVRGALQKASIPDVSDKIIADIDEAEDAIVMIPVLDVYGSCGTGIENYGLSTQVQLVGVPPTVARSWPGVVGTKGLHIIRASGDSMEPTIKSDSAVIVDTRQSRCLADGIYCIQTEGRIFIKRVQLNIDGTLTLISDNSRYSPMVVQKAVIDSLVVIGRVVSQVSIERL